jgi:uncharacterized protein (DUF1015 family)
VYYSAGVAELRPFSAYRPPPALVERVASPPYDVVTTVEARAFAAGNADSFMRVSRPEIDLPEGTDEHADETYAQGRKNLLELCERGVLVRDPEPRLYIYAQRMGEHRQIGIVACASVADYLADRIKKHEKTRPDKEDDRARHIEELSAHDEPVFLSYRARPAIDAFVERSVSAAPVYDFASSDDVEHRLWVLDYDRSLELGRLFASEVGDLYVADGHHRSAAAARVHQKLRGDGREHDVFMVVAFPHDQMQILPYNRLVTDPRGRSADELRAELSKVMDVVTTDDPAPEVTGSFGIYLGGRWYRATAMPTTFDPSDPIASLDCQICQEQILGRVFGITDPRRDPHLGFVGGIHGPATLAARVDRGEATAAIVLYPTRMEQVMRVSDEGAVMPPKSTWFEPKLKSGLFVHTF